MKIIIVLLIAFSVGCGSVTRHTRSCTIRLASINDVTDTTISDSVCYRWLGRHRVKRAYRKMLTKDLNLLP